MMGDGSLESLTPDQLLFAALAAPQDKLPAQIRRDMAPARSGPKKRTFTASEFRKVRKAMGPKLTEEEEKEWLAAKVEEAKRFKWLADQSEL